MLPGENSHDPHGADLSGLKVVVVEDDRPMRNLFTVMLHAAGITDIRMARTGIEALDLLNDFAADILITDFRMEGMDGLSLVRAVREAGGDRARDIRIIMVTGYTQKDRVVAAHQAGADAVLTKPVSAETLNKRIQSVLRDRPAAGPAGEQAGAPAGS